MEKPTSDLSEAERTLRAQFALMRPFCALAFGTFFTFGWHLVVKSMNVLLELIIIELSFRLIFRYIMMETESELNVFLSLRSTA